MEILGSLVLAIVQSILFYGKQIGISMLIFIVILNGIISYILIKKNKIKNKKGFLLLIPIILLSCTFFIFANTIFYIANIFIIILLNFTMYAIVINKRKYLRDYLYNTVELFIDTTMGYKDGIDYTKQKTKEHIKTSEKITKENIKKIAISILIVFAIVSMILILLISADSIFANLFSGMRELLIKINISSVFHFISRIAIIIILYFIFINLILNLQGENTTELKKLATNSEKYMFTIKLLLIVLNIIYLIFCFIQIKSLFARINVNSTFNYANYARTGFFQLMFVSLINFAIILISNKCNEKNEKIIKILNLFLVVFTIIIAISSMYRMYMYEIEYGLTYLRTFVYIILVTEILTFIPIIIYIFNDKFDFLKWCFIIVTCVYCGINFMNIEKIIIDKNLNRKSLRNIDFIYISKIASQDSYEVLYEKLNKQELSTSECLDITEILIRILSDSKELTPQEFNISKLKVRNKINDIENINKQRFDLNQKNYEENKGKTLVTSKEYVYREYINNNEEYAVEKVEGVTGTALWKITKYTDNGTKSIDINTMAVCDASKIKFFEGGLGFIEEPDSIYCAKSNLLITHDSGKTFRKINFPEGIFSISDPNGEEWAKCYDYFYLPTRDEDGNLTVLVSGGYEGGYNQGKTRAQYISRDDGYSWQFVSEVTKEL